jgi:hypothetical protein
MSTRRALTGSVTFINAHTNLDEPLLVMISPPSCHDPTDPAPQ